MKRIGHQSVLLALAGAMVLGPTLAFADDEFEVSGQISRVLMVARDGTRSKSIFADNGNANSRIRLRGSRSVGSGLEAGFLFEVGYPSNPSDDVSIDNSSVSAEWQERHVDLFVGGSWGKVSMGQGSGAANGAMEEDLSRTDIVSNSDMTSIGGGLEFQRAGSNPGPAIGDTQSNLDFEGRYDRLRYDSPKLGRWKISVSAGDKNENEVYEMAVRSSLKWRQGDMRVAAGYSAESRGGNAGTEQTLGASVSYVLPNGFNGTLAYGMRGRDGADSRDPNYLYFKVGYLLGPHAFSVDYGSATELDESGDRSTGYGAAYVYSAKKWLDVFGGLKQHSLHRDEASFDKITIATAGMRLKF